MIMTKLSFVESFSHPFTEDSNLLSLSLPLEGCYIQGGLDKFCSILFLLFFFLNLIWIFSVHSLNTVNAFLREKVKVKVIEEFYRKNSNFSNDCLFWHGWRENLARIQEIYIYETGCTRERVLVFRFDEDMHSSDRLWGTCFTCRRVIDRPEPSIYIFVMAANKDAFPFRVTFILTPSWRDLYTWSRVKYKLLGIIIVARSEQETRFERASPLNRFLLFVPFGGRILANFCSYL